MATEAPESIIKRMTVLKGKRDTWDIRFQELANFIQPRDADFTLKRTPGSKRHAKIFDGTAEDAAERFASGLHNSLTSEGNPWFFLKAADEEITNRRDVKIWLEDTTRRMYAVFNSPLHNFHPSQFEKYGDIGVYGTAIQFIGDEPGIGPYFQSHFLGTSYIDVDNLGRVDSVYRTFKLTARAAVQKFGVVPEVIRRSSEDSNTKKEFEFLHAVRPRPQEVQRFGNRTFPWASTYILMETKERVSEGGFLEFPFIIPRWAVNSEEIYGRSPGSRALADVKMLNAMEKTQLIGLQKMVDPPLEYPDDGYLRTVDLRPGALNVRRASMIGTNDRITPILTGGRPDLGEGKEEQKRQAIRRAFYNDVFELPSPIAPDGDVLHEGNLTVATRLRDRMAILGPIFSRLKTEDLSPMINRTLQIMVRRGMVQPVPEILQGANFVVEYVNPLAIAQGAGDVGAILQAVDALGSLAQVKPEVFDRLNPDMISSIIADRLNVPTLALFSDEQMAELRANRERAAAEQRQAELNQTNAGTVKQLSAPEGNAVN